MTRVLVLGRDGMLGAMLVAVLGNAGNLDVVGAGREELDARRDDPLALLEALRPDWVINAVGVLNARIDPGDPSSVDAAINVNGRFPQRLACAAGECGVRVIHVSTDGVFSGRDGPYDEDAPPDADDVYGRSKRLGEVEAEHVFNLRCSLVGPERGTPRSLLGRLLAQPPGAQVPGYADQHWNGITTLHLAQVCEGIVRSAQPAGGVVHVVPADVITKAQLLRLLASAYARDDLEIVESASGAPADRTLTTLYPQSNRALWHTVGHPQPPTIEAMIHELSRTPHVESARDAASHPPARDPP